MNTLNDERIERYLRNTMSESEKSAFQFELMQDKNLQMEVKAMRRLQKSLVADSRVSSRQGGTYKLWWFLPLLLLPLAYLFFNDTGEAAPKPTPPKTEITPPIAPSKDTENQETKEAETEEEKSTEDIINEYRPKEKKTQPEIKQPIALADPADLVPNPLFEQMTTGVRGGEMIVTPTHPAKNAIFNWQQNLSLSFTGEIETDATEKPTLNFLVFSNKKADFENWNYFLQTAAKIDKTDEGFSYSVNSTVSIKRGLYYYILEDQETEEPVLVGKFEIK